jgi:glycosyltransferase involved in cell wall biosynthesis
VVPIKYKGDGLPNLVNWLTLSESQELQVVAVNDLQPEDKSEPVRQILAECQHPNLNYFEGNFGNPGAARNFGIGKANREWVAFWDSDDQPMVSNFLDGVRKAMESKSQVMIGSFELRSDLDSDFSQTYSLSEETDLASELTLRPGVWRFAFKMNAMNIAKFPNSRMGEDQAFIALSQIFDKQISICSAPIYQYFVGNSDHQVSETSALKDMKISIRAIQEAIKWQSEGCAQFSHQLIAKQLITCIKNGPISLRLWGLAQTSKIFWAKPKQLFATGVLLMKNGGR